jgi:hypothetical protein
MAQQPQRTVGQSAPAKKRPPPPHTQPITRNKPHPVTALKQKQEVLGHVDVPETTHPSVVPDLRLVLDR